jgi:hypothetical protein
LQRTDGEEAQGHITARDLTSLNDAIAGPFSLSKQQQQQQAGPAPRDGSQPVPRERGPHETQINLPRDQPREGLHETREFRRDAVRTTEPRANPFSTQIMPRGPGRRYEELKPGATGRPISIVCKSCQKVTRKKSPYCDHCGRPLTNLEGSVLLRYDWTSARTPAGDPAVYVQLGVRPANRFLSGPPVRNLGFLIDMSTSRGEARDKSIERPKMIRKILEHVIDEMSSQDTLTVGFFGRRAYLFLAGEKMEDKKAAKRLIQKKMEALDLGEGRYLADGIEQVGREVRRNFSQEKVNRLIIVTDGMCSDPQEAVAAVRYENEAGIGFSTLSLGDGEHSKFMADLARAGNGKCYPKIEYRHVPEIFSQELMSIRPTFTTQVELFMHIDMGWSVSRVFKISPVIVDLGRKYAEAQKFSIKMADLQLYEDQSLLFEMSPVSVGPDRDTLALAELVCDFPRDDVLNMNFTMPVTAAATPEIWSHENEDVLKTVRMIMAVFGQKGLGFG